MIACLYTCITLHIHQLDHVLCVCFEDVLCAERVKKSKICGDKREALDVAKATEQAKEKGQLVRKYSNALCQDRSNSVKFVIVLDILCRPYPAHRVVPGVPCYRTMPAVSAV